MKKLIFVSFITLLITIISGCSNGGGSNPDKPPQPSGYAYKWSTSAPTTTATRPFSLFSSVVYAEGEEPTPTPTPIPGLVGSAVPPYGSIYENGTAYGSPAIYTYYNDVLVSSTYTYDVTTGTMSTTGVNHDIAIFVPKKPGKTIVTAQYNDETLQIPILIYYTLTINLGSSIDFDHDGVNDLNYIAGGINIPNGYQVINERFLSNITTAPNNGYNLTRLSVLGDPVIYLFKTSNNQYVKMLLASYGASGDTFYYLVSSDTQGNFEY